MLSIKRTECVYVLSHLSPDLPATPFSKGVRFPLPASLPGIYAASAVRFLASLEMTPARNRDNESQRICAAL